VTVDVRRMFEDPPRAVRYAVRVVTAIELGIGAAAMLLIFFLVFVQALQRYLPVDGWPWTGELARFSLVWLTFVVAGVLVTRDGHISIEMIDAVPGERLRRAVRVLSCLIVAAVAVALTVAAWELVEEQGILKSPAMQMPMSWLYAISMIGFVSTVVRSLVAAATYAVLGVPEPSYDELEAPTA
jgi:TRAP-type transport system small permease protein